MKFSGRKKPLIASLAAALVVVSCAAFSIAAPNGSSNATDPSQQKRTPAISYSNLAIPYQDDGEGGGIGGSGRKSFLPSEDHVTGEEILAMVPDFSGKGYVRLNGNVPQFSENELNAPLGTEEYGNLDSLGRCTYAFAVTGKETQPTGKRNNISDVKPSGWKQNMDLHSIGLDHLYERSHLIAHKLTAEDANPNNLITGTHYLNQGAMSEFETQVCNYINAAGGHVLMRVTPVFANDELVARGVQMEALSLEDNGASVCYNVYCYNVQPDVTIDYATGRSWLSDRTDR